MSEARSWLLKSLLIGAAAGLAAFVLSYGFLTIHEEVGVRPNASLVPALAVFALVTVAALIYFRVRTGR